MIFFTVTLRKLVLHDKPMVTGWKKSHACSFFVFLHVIPFYKNDVPLVIGGDIFSYGR